MVVKDSMVIRFRACPHFRGLAVGGRRVRAPVMDGVVVRRWQSVPSRTRTMYRRASPGCRLAGVPASIPPLQRQLRFPLRVDLWTPRLNVLLRTVWWPDTGAILGGSVGTTRRIKDATSLSQLQGPAVHRPTRLSQQNSAQDEVHRRDELIWLDWIKLLSASPELNSPSVEMNDGSCRGL